jgi:hypothetical protein
MDEIWVEHSSNVIAGSTVSANGDVLVGGQKVTNYFYSAQYQDLKKQLDELQVQLSKTRQKTEKYPDDQDFKTDLLRIDETRNEVQKKLDDLKSEVIRLAETFAKIPINTERLKFAREHFEKGDYAAAQAVLDAEQMGNELDALLEQKEQLQHQQAENEANLLDKANEFLILARLTAVDYNRWADRYEKTTHYFEQSLKAAHTLENTIEYAYFLHEYHQFAAATPFFAEALASYRRLAEGSPETYLPKVAQVLNKLAISQADRNEFAAAQAGYNEAVAIYRHLAEANPEVYLPDVAQTLDNLATLQRDRKEFAAAQAGYNEAVAIYRHLALANLEDWLPYVALTLGHLAILHRDRKEFAAAQAAYEEEAGIYSRLAEATPEGWLPYAALALNDLANLHEDRKEFAVAQATYEEGRRIYRRLAELNPHWLPLVKDAEQPGEFAKGEE